MRIQSRQAITEAIEDERDERQAFLLIAAGGTGRDALKTFASLYQLEFDSPATQVFGKLCLYVDTEPAHTFAADATMNLSVGNEEFDALRSDPRIFGPVTATVVRELPQFVRAESLRDGSRTIRILTQMAAEVHQERIKRTLNEAIRKLVKSSGANNIVPIIIASTGGGAGSALVVILGALLHNHAFQSAITEGFRADLLHPPIAVLTDPYAYSLRHNSRHASRILSNAFATRVELAALAKRGCFQYIFMQGMSNGETLLDTKDEICRNLGSSVYQLCRNFSYLKSRLVDTVDSDRWDARYRGFDTPEFVLDESTHPLYASKRRPRTVQNSVSLADSNGRTGK